MNDDINELSREVIGAAIEVHQVLGPGLLESSYQTALSHELGLRHIPHQTEVIANITYKGIVLEKAYRIDILVENRLILELKAVDTVLEIHKAQLLSYLRHSRIQLGLLINFNRTLLKSGVNRVINSHQSI